MFWNRGFNVLTWEGVRDIVVDPDAVLSRAELIAALSRALDLTEGEPMGHAMRACWIGMKIGQALELSLAERKELYYGLLLKDAGCTANAQQVSAWFGTDDRTAKYALKTVNWSNLWSATRYAMGQAKPGAPWHVRMQQMVSIGKRGPQAARELVAMRCTRGADIVRRLGWADLAPDAVLNLDEHWDGSGHPRGLKGEAIPILARILSLAQTVEFFWGRSGSNTARAIAEKRRGTWFDPQLVDIFLVLSRNANFWQELRLVTSPRAIAQLDPAPSRISLTTMEQLLQVAHIFGEIVDSKTSWTAQHSVRTADYAGKLAQILGWDKRQQQDTVLAGFFHDLGKVGVSNLILDKPGPLDTKERQAIERHPELTFNILEPIAPLRSIAHVAASHHERLDGSGYYQHSSGSDIPGGGLVVAVADVFDALAHARPYRRQLNVDEVLALMRKEKGSKLWAPAMDALEWGLAHRIIDAADTDASGV
ncbi:MAG: phosphohydrolase [Sulfobacillus acidophilus]|uniref:Phosphohydrolase n=1 Tax=Sulfobacillus acidophilus TaxID=53633 RepID=A0A2T2WK62_9FIRM|nr:MAG: phosphohydrolase [Sulfobacillus acidophilus]